MGLTRRSVRTVVFVSLIVVAFTAASCTGEEHQSAAAIALEVTPASVQPGDVVEIKVLSADEDESEWGVDISLQKMVAGSWKTAYIAGAGKDDLEPVLLRPISNAPAGFNQVGFSGSGTQRVRLAEDTPPGRYRIAKTVSSSDEPMTAPLDVEEPGA